MYGINEVLNTQINTLLLNWKADSLSNGCLWPPNFLCICKVQFYLKFNYGYFVTSKISKINQDE